MAINFGTSGVIRGSGADQISIFNNGNIKHTQPTFIGHFNAVSTSASNYNPYLNTTLSRNVVVDATASSITVPSDGFYHIYCHQLVASSGGVYLLIKKNGTGIYHAYSDNDPSYDMNISCVAYLAANDVISFSITGTTTTTWGIPHSSVTLHFIG